MLKLFKGLIDAATYDEFRRLPELFCGFSPPPQRGPTAYPVACSPQAWAAAAPFALVAAATGSRSTMIPARCGSPIPPLPDFLDDLMLRGVTVAGSRLDLRLARFGDDVTTAVVRRDGDVVVTITK